MATVYERPAGAYDSTTTTTNKDKYQTDSGNGTAISSQKVDGDINKLIDAVNTLGTDIDNVIATGLPNQTGNADKMLKTDGTTASWASVDTANIASDAVTTVKILDGNITGAKISSNAVTTTKVADNNITKAKIEQANTMTVLGNTTALTANIAEVSVLDEDNMVSNSATALSTQQSIKAYVDNKILVNKFCTLRDGSGTAVPTTTYTKQNFDTVVDDTNSWADTTNNRIIPNINGYYIVSSANQWSVSSGTCIIIVYKNGAQVYRSQRATPLEDVNITTPPISMNGSTDYLEIFLFQSSGGTVTTSSVIGENWFSIHKV